MVALRFATAGFTSGNQSRPISAQCMNDDQHAPQSVPACTVPSADGERNICGEMDCGVDGKRCAQAAA
jgi:hypothetical protein